MRERARSVRRSLNPDTVSGAVVLYLLLSAVFCFWRLGAVGVIHMEGLIVDGGEHMLESGDWLVPRVYDEVYTYKPALAYWFAAAALVVADPPPAWLVRLPFAASGFLMGLVVLLLVLRVARPRVAFVAAVASVSAGLFVQHVRLAEFDVPLAAGVGVAVAAACVNLVARKASGPVWWLAYAGLLVGFLAKGLPALMCFGPGLVAAAVAVRRLQRLFDWRHLAAALFFVLAAGGYLFGAYRSVGAAAFEQPLLESKVRGLSWSVRQESDVLSVLGDDAASADEEAVAARPLDAILETAGKPLTIWSSFLPWSLLLLFAFARRGEPEADGEELLLDAGKWFLLVTIVAFLLIPTNKTRYFLPLAVPVGLVCAAVLTGSGRRQERMLMATGVGAALSGLAMVAMGVSVDTPPVPMVHRAILVAGGIALLVWMSASLRRKRVERTLALMILACAGWLATESLAAQVRRAAGGRDLRPQAAELEPLVPPTATLWVLGPSDPASKHASLYFYLDRPTRAFRPPDRLPPRGSYCLLTTDRMPDAAALDFAEIARVSTNRFTYLLGRCGAGGDAAASSKRTGLPPASGGSP